MYSRSQRIVICLALLAGCASAAAQSAPGYCAARAAQSPSERIVCATPALFALHDQSNRLTQQALEAVQDRPSFYREQAARWNQREADCKDADCLHSWYSDNIAWLNTVVASNSGVRHTKPESRQLAEYERQVIPLRESIALAHVAAFCNLRSPAWFESLTTSYGLTKIYFQDKLGVGQDDRDIFNMHEAQADRRVLAAHPLADPKTCNTLRNSAQMTRLDELQARATANYR